MKDVYVADPSLLRGTPKLTIGDYAERNGILVPRRFATLDEAVASGKDFIIRSEHTVEYDGPSDLADSYPITEKLIQRYREGGAARSLNPAATDIRDIDDLRGNDFRAATFSMMQIGAASSDHVIEQLKIAAMKYSYKTPEFCRLTGYDKERFMSEFTFSFWELLPGFNRSIIADSAVKGRYHIFTSKEKDTDNTTPSYFHNYSIIDAAGPQIELLQPFTDEMRSDLPNIIAFYEKIRNLPNFDPAHCPMVEFQTVGTEHFFLQYHRTRDFNPTTFTLERSLEPGEIKAEFVRGATPPEGIVVQTGTNYPEFYSSGNPVFKLNDEDASFDIHDYYMFSELMLRKRKAQFIDDTHHKMACKVLGQHIKKSSLFKPGVSAGVQWKSIQQDEKESRRVWVETRKTGIPHRIPIRVVSDGTTCYVKRMDV